MSKSRKLFAIVGIAILVIVALFAQQIQTADAADPITCNVVETTPDPAGGTDITITTEVAVGTLSADGKLVCNSDGSWVTPDQYTEPEEVTCNVVETTPDPAGGTDITITTEVAVGTLNGKVICQDDGNWGPIPLAVQTPPTEDSSTGQQQATETIEFLGEAHTIRENQVGCPSYGGTVALDATVYEFPDIRSNPMVIAGGALFTARGVNDGLRQNKLQELRGVWCEVKFGRTRYTGWVIGTTTSASSVNTTTAPTNTAAATTTGVSLNYDETNLDANASGQSLAVAEYLRPAFDSDQAALEFAIVSRALLECA